MDKNLPPRPNLDHLRRQAKELLAALTAGDADAVDTFQQHLPAAEGMTGAQVRAAGFRLADAQSAIARRNGFASWPQLARHVQQLRALEGSWAFDYLEVDGVTMPTEGLGSSRILIDGDRFRTEAPEGSYEGVFTVDVEAEPHRIDIEFIAGPEAGNHNYGIYRLDGDRLEICLDMGGADRPTEFRTAPGRGHAYERLRRSSAERPEGVTGGTPPSAGAVPARQKCVEFEYVESATLSRLQGEWSAVRLVRDGQEMPAAMLHTGTRSAAGNELKVSFGGQMVIHALVRIDEAADPVGIDYYHLSGALQGMIQHGVMRWIAEEVTFNMAPPCHPRPSDFSCPTGSGRILSQWRKNE